MDKWTQAWLSYTLKRDMGNGRYTEKLAVVGFGRNKKIIENAVCEWKCGVKGMLGADVAVVEDDKLSCGIRIIQDLQIPAEGYSIREEEGVIELQSADGKGVLYGVFHLLRRIAMERPLSGIDISCKPDNPLRMYDHWDNMDGSIERGYSGRSFFFCCNEIIIDGRTRDYCRLVSSVGINGVVINNVNVGGAATWLVTGRYLDQVKELADLFEGYGIKLFLSLNLAAVMELGGLPCADPKDEDVVAWWKEKMAEVYGKVPGLGGFLVKADSEGRPGPFTYGRTQAEGANMLADLINPFGGILIWRCFVYNCRQDWRDYKTDRACAAYQNFIPTDGDYHENVILQIKNGPMDFQIREPVSPLFGGLKKTNQMMEVQIAQEYTGHQIDVCYLIPMFKEILEFRTWCADGCDTVADIISGRTLGNSNAGIAAVCNTGDDANWTGNDLAAANFYGFGRLAYNTGLSAVEIAEEWIRQALSNDEEVVEKVSGILLKSRSVYEKYTSPLGIGWMVNPDGHYGPGVDGYEYSRWGTYHRADLWGLGVDRSEGGTGFAQQYYEPNASMYNSMETCPEELLLFFHHVPYSHQLKTGKTVIQHIYDTHFEGVEEVENMIGEWKSLEGKLAGTVFETVLQRFQMQLDNAMEWRDQVNSYFYRKCGIPDEKGRKIY